MSLHQKYTWADFLKNNPDWKKKGVKRTSKEGKKAFEDAFKTHAKTHLKDLTARLEREVKRVTARRDAIVARLKATTTGAAAKIVQARVGRKDHALVALTRQIDRAKAAAKSL